MKINVKVIFTLSYFHRFVDFYIIDDFYIYCALKLDSKHFLHD